MRRKETGVRMRGHQSIQIPPESVPFRVSSTAAYRERRTRRTAAAWTMLIVLPYFSGSLHRSIGQMNFKAENSCHVLVSIRSRVEALPLKQGRGTEVYFGSGLVTLFSLGDKKQLIAASAVSPLAHGKLRRDFRCLPACLLDEPLGMFALSQSSMLPPIWPTLEPGQWRRLSLIEC